MTLQTPLLNPRPFSVMVWDWEHSQSEDKWEKLYGLFGQWHPGKYHHADVCKQSFTTSGANYWPHGFQSHLCGVRQCLHKTVGLHGDPGSGDGVQGYNEDQIALVIPDLSNFAARVPVILGTPTIGQVVNVMREAEMDALAAHLLSVCRMTPMEVGDGQEEKFDVNDDDQLMYTQKAETIEPFSSHIVPVKTGRAYVGECTNVMVQALQTQDGSLSQGLTVQNTYTELRKGSKKAVVVVQNNTAYLQTLWKKTPVARAVAALPVPEPPKGRWLWEGADKFHDSYTPRLTVRQRHSKLFNKLDFSSLDLWTLELVDAACQLLAKYHDVFSLDLAGLGCTHSTEHIIKVTDDTPFKEQFRQIPPPMVEEVRNHLKEMLESWHHHT